MQIFYNITKIVMSPLALLANVGALYGMVRKKSFTAWITLDGTLLLLVAKTRIAKVAKRFNFLGYRIAEYCIEVSMGAGKRFRARLLRLHEQRGGLLPLKQYIRHWFRWATTDAAVEKLQL